MTGSLFQCTAADLATKNLETLSPDLSVGEAHEWLATNEYDVAPVVTDAGPQGYADIEVLSDAPSEAILESHLSTISLSNIIGSDAAFGDVLTALYETPRYFLGGRNEVTGILTRADLNKSPAYIHLFDRLSTLEERLTELIIKQEIDWKTTASFDDDTIKAWQASPACTASQHRPRRNSLRTVFDTDADRLGIRVLLACLWVFESGKCEPTTERTPEATECRCPLESDSRDDE